MSTYPLKEPEPDPERGDDAQHGFDGGSGGGYDGPMHRRVNRLEEFANEARQRFDRIDATLADLGGRHDRSDSRMDRFDARMERVETRLERVETRLERVETRLDNVERRLERVEARLEFTATKEDVQKAANSIIKWMIGVLVALSMAAITIITFVLNYATPPRPTAAAPAQPIVIYAPSPPEGWPAQGDQSGR